MIKRAVLDEQCHKKDTEYFDPQYIATLYKTVKDRSRVEANIMGIRDEVAVKNCADGDFSVTSVNESATNLRRCYGQRLEV
jgi:oligoribonuclease NrnB/cAMP/cGMP phosphodiesterase (DHH superfamily)